jgi:hypothetical protein
MNWLVSHNAALLFPIDNSVPSKNVEAARADTLFMVQTELTCEEPTGEPGRSPPSEQLNANLRGVEERAGLDTGEAVDIESVTVKTIIDFIPSGRFCAAVRQLGSQDFEFLPSTGVEPVFSHATRTATAELPIARYTDAIAILFEGNTKVNEITVRKKKN